ncbi:MAG: hydrogenase maturation protease [Gammaproteobacteria bacterium]|nr:hydrogenase maturation protease [Gammaproteobacteria bacterium]
MNYIAGLGQFMRGDDGIGIHVIEYLEANYPPSGHYQIIDLSDNIWSLLPFLVQATDKILIIDCSYMGKVAGEYTLFTVDNIIDEMTEGEMTEDRIERTEFTEAKVEMGASHVTSIRQFLQLAEKSGNYVPDILIMGIEPETVDYSVELSKALQQQLPKYAAIAVNSIS